jgi:hypothetical protein
MEKNRKQIINFVIVAFFIATLLSAAYYLYHKNIFKNTLTPTLTFSEKMTLEETGKISASLSPNWWLNSGGVMEIGSGSAQTNFGSLPENSRWQKLYAKTNPRDTDGGYFPQNIFRLVTRGKWQDLDQQLYFKIDKINMSDSDYRNESNGVLLFNRYHDGDNLYYVGLRVDGHAVIKKKIDDKYYTLAEKDILSGGKEYDRNDNPNFLPLHRWIGIRSVVTNTGSQSVDIKFYVDLEQTGNWQLILETKDKGNASRDVSLTDPGRAGIRTDFMDVAFQDYKIQ